MKKNEIKIGAELALSSSITARELGDSGVRRVRVIEECRVKEGYSDKPGTLVEFLDGAPWQYNDDGEFDPSIEPTWDSHRKAMKGAQVPVANRKLLGGWTEQVRARALALARETEGEAQRSARTKAAEAIGDVLVDVVEAIEAEARPEVVGRSRWREPVIGAMEPRESLVWLLRVACNADPVKIQWAIDEVDRIKAEEDRESAAAVAARIEANKAAEKLVPEPVTS